MRSAPSCNFIISSTMSANPDANSRQLFRAPQPPPRDPLQEQIDPLPNSTLLDPYKSLLPDRPEVTCLDLLEIPNQTVNFRSFLSNDSQFGDVPHDIPSFSSNPEDEYDGEGSPFKGMVSRKHRAHSSTQDAEEDQQRIKYSEPGSQLRAHNNESQQNYFRPSKTARKKPITKTRTTCKCKKSKYEKMYCECYLNGNSCGKGCECVECSNGPVLLQTKRKKRSKNVGLPPLYFPVQLPPLQLPIPAGAMGQGVEAPGSKGCSCKKNQCVKKYCECFNSGKGCDQQCKCSGCLNQVQELGVAE